jgi:hypothetical protein
MTIPGRRDRMIRSTDRMVRTRDASSDIDQTEDCAETTNAQRKKPTKKKATR